MVRALLCVGALMASKTAFNFASRSGILCSMIDETGIGAFAGEAGMIPLVRLLLLSRL